jgi:hypothetical protein
MNHVFVSYSRKDSQTVDQIVARLEQDTFNAWIDREEIHGGDLWREEIVEAIDTAYAFVLMLSPASVTSDNVRKEVDLAEGATKALIPVLLASVKLPSRLRYQLAGIQWIEYYRDHEAKYRELVEVLRTHQPKPGARKTPTTREVEFVLKGLDPSQFGTEKQEQLLDLIADFTGTPRTDISLEKLTAGSVHAFVRMPATAAYRIKTAALNRDVRLINFGIDALRLTGDRHFVVLKTGSIAPPKSGKPGGPRWFIGGLALMIALFMSAIVIATALSPAKTWISSFFNTATPTPTNTFTPTPSNTPTPTKTLTPTSSPTSTFTPTWTPTPTMTSTPSPLTITGLAMANCRTGPSVTYEVYSNLRPGQTVQVFARNALSTWFLSENPRSDFRYYCWISIGKAVQVNGDPSDVPVVWIESFPDEFNPSSKPPHNGGDHPLPGIDLPLNLYCVIHHCCPSGFYWISGECQAVPN